MTDEVKKIIVYFHGYGSNAKTEKVELLKQVPNSEVYSYDIDIDPDVSNKYLTDMIDMLLLTDMHVPANVVFVGTSLGAWYASKVASLYGIEAVLINPLFTPASSLLKYGVPINTASKYSSIIPRRDLDTYFFAKHDTVIDNTDWIKALNEDHYNVNVIENADHRFGGEAFELVIEHLT